MSGTPLPALAAAARDVLRLLAERNTAACLIGALAVHRWGEPRATRDVDITVVAPYGEETIVIDALLERFAPRRPDAREFAVAHRVLLVRSAAGVEIDVALAAFPFEIEALERSSDWEMLAGVNVRTCSAEHLVVYKLVAGRPQDLVDVESVVRRQGRRLELDLIRRWLVVFAELKEEPDLARPFEAAFAKVPQS
jgi:hypothetical protein